MTRMELLLQGDFLGLIKAEVFVSASYDFVSFSGASFYVRVTVDLSGINAVRFRGRDVMVVCPSP